MTAADGNGARTGRGGATATTEAPARDVDLALARLHLRLGLLPIARAELEALAGSGRLDDEGLTDLAEARWRTGDLVGAGHAATAALDAGRDDLVALVVAAEATAGLGRPSEARKLAGRALERSNVPMDQVFAGMPRASIWPADPVDPSAGPGFDGGTLPVGRADAAGQAAAWDAGEVQVPDPATELSAGRAALAMDPARAAVHLAVALRLGPTLAPAVLDLLEGSRAPELELVRGDAFRLVGHESDARRAFARAATSAIATGADPETGA
ncbi:MAG: hypothetical protein ACJ761_07345 [Chloroflexota bacterium]